MNRNYRKPQVAPHWAHVRNTDLIVATAIHAISSNARPPEKIWESPSSAEWENVIMGIEDYLRHGDFEPDKNGRYSWGEETITLKL